jgi:hypothetical protein
MPSGFHPVFLRRRWISAKTSPLTKTLSCQDRVAYSSVSTQTGASGRTPMPKLQVLVLDDEPIVGKRLKLALSKMGCEV